MSSPTWTMSGHLGTRSLVSPTGSFVDGPPRNHPSPRRRGNVGPLSEYHYSMMGPSYGFTDRADRRHEDRDLPATHYGDIAGPPARPAYNTSGVDPTPTFGDATRHRDSLSAHRTRPISPIHPNTSASPFSPYARLTHPFLSRPSRHIPSCPTSPSSSIASTATSSYDEVLPRRISDWDASDFAHCYGYVYAYAPHFPYDARPEVSPVHGGPLIDHSYSEETDTSPEIYIELELGPVGSAPDFSFPAEIGRARVRHNASLGHARAEPVDASRGRLPAFERAFSLLDLERAHLAEATAWLAEPPASPRPAVNTRRGSHATAAFGLDRDLRGPSNI